MITQSVILFEVSAQHSDWSGALVQNTPAQFAPTHLHPAHGNGTQSTTSQVNTHSAAVKFSVRYLMLVVSAHFLNMLVFACTAQKVAKVHMHLGRNQEDNFNL